LQDFPSHFKTCPYAGVRCALGCGLLVARRDAPEHEAGCEHQVNTNFCLPRSAPPDITPRMPPFLLPPPPVCR
jgi:hypothetical protein